MKAENASAGIFLPPSVARAAFGAIAIFILVMAWYSCRTYYSRYFIVAATRGVHGEREYEDNLRQSIRFDPAFGHARLLLARLLMKRGDNEGALSQQRQGMSSFRPVRAFAQMGSIREKQEARGQAVLYFQRALRMYPAYIEVLQSLAVLALREGDSEALDWAVGHIKRIDLNDINSYYLLARDAEQVGNLQTALMNYKKISAMLTSLKVEKDQLLFDPGDVALRIRQIQESGGTR
ncbi:MAG: hypothetical protein NTY46_11330 [Candidatus Sumerlaeota bacterium]|nr:hypothetical protein [Candidatus Sumerlaeota bacterium]